jgi:hypothetical protein
VLSALALLSLEYYGAYQHTGYNIISQGHVAYFTGITTDCHGKILATRQSAFHPVHFVPLHFHSLSDELIKLLFIMIIAMSPKIARCFP